MARTVKPAAREQGGDGLGGSAMAMWGRAGPGGRLSQFDERRAETRS